MESTKEIGVIEIQEVAQGSPQARLLGAFYVVRRAGNKVWFGIEPDRYEQIVKTVENKVKKAPEDAICSLRETTILRIFSAMRLMNKIHAADTVTKSEREEIARLAHRSEHVIRDFFENLPVGCMTSGRLAPGEHEYEKTYRLLVDLDTIYRKKLESLESRKMTGLFMEMLMKEVQNWTENDLVTWKLGEGGQKF